MDELILDRFRRAETVQLAAQLESLLVAGNLRGMETVFRSGYRDFLLPAVETLLRNYERVAIVSGFPVAGSFETDGPAGALALAQALTRLGSEVVLLGVSDYAQALLQALPAAVPDGDVLRERVVAVERANSEQQLQDFARGFQPTLVVFIEVPGRGVDGCYRNMRFEDIGGCTLRWETLAELVSCPTLAIADGGNELGMGKVHAHLQGLPVAIATAATDQLVIADVSNWGAYALLALASAATGRALLEDFCLARCLDALVSAGMVDGVTGCANATEDGLPQVRSRSLLEGVRALAAPFVHTNADAPLRASSHGSGIPLDHADMVVAL